MTDEQANFIFRAIEDWLQRQALVDYVEGTYKICPSVTYIVAENEPAVRNCTEIVPKVY